MLRSILGMQNSRRYRQNMHLLIVTFKTKASEFWNKFQHGITWFLCNTWQCYPIWLKCTILPSVHMYSWKIWWQNVETSDLITQNSILAIDCLANEVSRFRTLWRWVIFTSPTHFPVWRVIPSFPSVHPSVICDYFVTHLHSDSQESWSLCSFRCLA